MSSLIQYQFQNRLSYSDIDKEPAEDLLLRRYRLIEEQKFKARDYNLKAGLDKRLLTEYIPDGPLSTEKKYQRFLAMIKNQYGKFNTIKFLKGVQLIPDQETPYDNIDSFPQRELVQLQRIKDRLGREYLKRVEMWYGLKSNGEIMSISVGDLDYTVKLKTETVYADLDDSPEQRTKNMREMQSYGNNYYATAAASKLQNKINLIRFPEDVHYRAVEPMGDTVYLTEYTPEKVDQFLSYARGSVEDPYNGTSLGFYKLGGINPLLSITSIGEFKGDFDTVWNNSWDRINRVSRDNNSTGNNSGSNTGHYR